MGQVDLWVDPWVNSWVDPHEAVNALDRLTPPARDAASRLAARQVMRQACGKPFVRSWISPVSVSMSTGFER